MLTYNPKTDIMCDVPIDNWPTYYPEYNSPEGWELQKLDAKIEICKEVFKDTKSSKVALKVLAIKAEAEIKRHDIIGKYIFNN